MSYAHIREEELKNKVAQDYFIDFDCTKIIGNIDFCVVAKTSPLQESLYETPSLLWAEAKKGSADLYKALVQLILTIGKARTFDKTLPAAFLGAFDAEKIAFVPYNSVQEVFYQNDFNWNVAPSNQDSKEFKQLFQTVQHIIDENSLLFQFEKEAQELKDFIKSNFIEGNLHFSKIQIDKNNFITIYNKWLQTVKPTIAADWDLVKKGGLIDGDFYLADLLSLENQTIKDKLFVLLNNNHYELDRKIDDWGMFSSRRTAFHDGQKAHQQFWKKYERPPKEQYWDYIVARRDLLVPQDIRERKGSFFTPQIWVELSQQYLADTFGQNWQDEYYVWDCAAGTGNLLAGLTNKYNIYASTLDKQDVDVMHDRIKNGANLLEKQVFQFDFLNDDFSKLPASLQDIINDSEKRKKLIIYINPPYVEGDARLGRGRKEVHLSKTHDKYRHLLGKASSEIFAQFFIRIQQEIKGCKLAEFSTLKILQAPNFKEFRQVFLAKLYKMFLMPADTFDNVKGQFPIGFMVWDTEKPEIFTAIQADVYEAKGNKKGKKKIFSYDNAKLISVLIEKNKIKNDNEIPIARMSSTGNDFQNQNALFIENVEKKKKAGGRHTFIYKNNLIKSSVYYTVRKIIRATWLNDRDQFLYPHKSWEKDTIFQNNCLVYTLFNNNIQSQYGTNHWIPFTEREVEAQERFKSNFMTEFIQGKLQIEGNGNLLESEKNRTTPLEFSTEAQAVFAAGLALWRYYHAQPKANPNASLYEIKAFFQGRNDKGRMNSKSEDAHYTKLLSNLKEKLHLLSKKIEPKVYQYGFLKD